MITISFGQPVAKLLYGFGGVEVIGGKIASPLRKRTLNDPATFEITQTAAQHVASGVGSAEPAVDIGNGHCGEPILALARGWASRRVEPSTLSGAPTDALGVIIDHGAGVWTEYWHLSGWAIPPSGAFVNKGQVIGYLGSTGLGGRCHCHVMLRVAGVAIDPEPYLWGAVLTIEEDDVLASKTVTLAESFCFRTGAGNKIRSDTTNDDANVTGSSKAGEYTCIGIAQGFEYNRTRDFYVFLQEGTGLRAIHAGLCEKVPKPVAGITEEQAKARESIAADKAAGLAARFVAGAAAKAAEGFKG